MSGTLYTLLDDSDIGYQALERMFIGRDATLHQCVLVLNDKVDIRKRKSG